MGGKQSTVSSVRNEANTLVVNRSDITIINKELNDIITNTVVDVATNCAANVVQTQTISFVDMEIKGNFDIDEVIQGQKAAVDFNCSQVKETRNEIVQEMMSKVMNTLN